MIQNCSLQKDLQIFIVTFCYKVFIFLFNLKTYFQKSIIQVFKQNLKHEKNVRMRNRSLQ